MGRNIITASYPKSHPELKVVNKNNSQPKIHGQQKCTKVVVATLSEDFLVIRTFECLPYFSCS